MKKLTYSALLACAFAFCLISCKKSDVEPPGPPPPPSAQPKVQTVFITGTDAEISLNAYSSLPGSIPFIISIDGQFKEEFFIQTNAKKKWQLGNLKTGTHQVRIYSAYQGNDSGDNYSVFQFTIDDGKTIQDLICRKLDARNYGFDINVKKLILVI